MSIKRRVTVTGAALLLAIGGSVVTASAANAEAHGTVGIPPHVAVTLGNGVAVSVQVPVGGVMKHSIFGSGRTSSHQEATAGGVRLCAARIDWVALGSGDKEISRTQGTTVSGCTSQVTQWRGKHTYSTNVRKDCAQYLANAVSKARQCHSIG